MSKTTVYNQKGEKVKELELNSKIFGLEINEALVTHAVVIQQSNKRQNLAHVKDRSDVRGGGRKPWRQKGTGRARHGSSRSPIWRGGGVTFGPSNVRNFSLKINKKAKRKAILMTLSDKAANQKIILLDSLSLEEGKTKKLFEILQNLKLRDKKVKAKTIKAEDDKKSVKGGSQLEADAPKEHASGGKTKRGKSKSVLLVLPGKDEKIKRAARNIVRVDAIRADSLNVLDIVKMQYLLMPVDSIEKIKKTFISSNVKVPVSVKTVADKSEDKK